MRKVGRNFISDRARWYVGGVDTIIGLKDDPRLSRVRFVVPDEAHHVLKVNKWGKAMLMFPGAFGFMPTATPTRADKKGLGREYDGLADVLIDGPQTRWLMDQGFLVDYEVICPKTTDLDLHEVNISADGDYNQVQLRKAVHKSKKIVGDIVRTYLQFVPGKKAVYFAVDVEAASLIANGFKDAGVPAEVVSAKTPDALRDEIMRRYENNEIRVLVNVDLFGEGFDLPDVDVVGMARPTMSFSLYRQQVGRSFRLNISKVLETAWDTYTVYQRLQFIAQSKKPKAIIIDHVGNIERHGLPDAHKEFSLEPGMTRARGEPNDEIPMRSCLNPICLKPYEKYLTECPYCHTEPSLPALRSSPEMVDGDMHLLDMDALKAMRAAVQKVDGHAYMPKGIAPGLQGTIIAKHVERQHAQKALRDMIALWAGKHNKYTDRVNYKRFYLTFGLQVLEAMALGTEDANRLREKIAARI
jgi:DNA repair protein RadD